MSKPHGEPRSSWPTFVRSPSLPFAILLLVPLAWFFGPSLTGPRTLAYRDAGNFYYPLFAWQCGQWSEGRVPLWNPQADGGMPAVADATSSTFYPGKLLFALPVEYRLRFHLYMVTHVAWAAVSLYWVARCWGRSREGASLGALAYAFGGVVLFQYANVVYLVSAAWLPWAAWAIDRMLRRRSWQAAVALGMVLALMTLGGDPQTAYNTGLAAVLYAVILAVSRRRRARRLSGLRRGLGSGFALRRAARWRPALLLVAAGSSLLLAAIQVVPSIPWTLASRRAAADVPRNLYEAAAAGRSPASLLAEPEPGTHAARTYGFSVGPWRLAECIWPNVYGRAYPVNRRWISALPAEGGFWTPSLYCGLLPLLLGLSCLLRRVRGVRVRWLGWLIVLATLGSFGRFGLGSLVHEVRYAALGPDAAGDWLGQPVGGLYWLMVVALPGYAYFRYPAKLLVFAALGIGLLAARGWDEQARVPPRRLMHVVTAIGLLSLVIGGGFVLLRPAWETWVTAAPPDLVFGPVDSRGAQFDLLRGLLHTALLCLILGLGIGRARRTSTPMDRAATAQPLPRFLLVVTATELSLAGGWMFETVASDLLDGPPRLASIIARSEHRFTRDPSIVREREPFRVFRTSATTWRPSSWAQTSSPDRLAEVVAWEHATLRPRHQLLTDVALIQSHSTLASRDFQAFLEVAEAAAEADPLAGNQGLDALSARYRIGPLDAGLANGRRMEPASLVWQVTGIPETTLTVAPTAFPEAWIVRDVVAARVIPGRTAADSIRAAREVLMRDGQPRDLRRTAVVQAAGELPKFRSTQAFDPARERCEIVMNHPTHVRVEVELAEPGLLVLNHRYFTGWSAETRNGPNAPPARAEILRTNRIMRGVPLAAGRTTVDFHYRPTEFRLAATASILAAVAASLLLAIRRRSPRRSAAGPTGNSRR